MSRIGKLHIEIPSGVSLEIQKESITASGPKGKLTFRLHSNVSLEKPSDTELAVGIIKEGKDSEAIQGSTRNIISNMIMGVDKGWIRQLEMQGVGYRASVAGKNLNLQVGFSHPVQIVAPDGIEFTVAENKININGIDKQVVGEIAAKIRKVKPPEPYKGKGIRYTGEKVRRKAGKTAKAVGGAK